MIHVIEALSDGLLCLEGGTRADIFETRLGK